MSFSDANSLAQALAGVVTSVSYDASDPNNPLLVYHVHLAPQLSPTNVPLSFTEQVGNLSDLSTAAQLTATPSATLDFDFGADLSPLGASFQFASPPQSTLLSALNGGNGVTFNIGVSAADDLPYGPGQPSTDAASNGQLAANLNFTVVINGTSYPVSLLSSATQNNSSIADLVNELNSSLVTALNGSPDSGMLAFRSSGSALALAATDPSITSIAISGAAALGFSASQSSDDDIQISLHNGQQFDVKLKGSVTLGDVINSIQNGTGGLVTVTIDTTNKCLDLQDNTTGPGTFSVTALNGSLAGTAQVGLGLLGSEVNGDGIIEGATLSGDSLANHLFVRNVSVDEAVGVSATNISATANFGLLGVAISGGSASARPERTLPCPSRQTLRAGGSASRNSPRC